MVLAGVQAQLGRASTAALGRALTSSVAYDVVLTPFVVPVVGLLVRRVDPDAARRRA